MDEARLFAVSLVDIVLAGGGSGADEVVEGDGGAFEGGELIADAKDFMICETGY